MKSNPVTRFFTPRLLLLLALYAIGFQLVIDFSNWLQGNLAGFTFLKSITRFLINYPNLLLVCYLDFLMIKMLDRYLPWHIKKWTFIRIITETIAGTFIISALVIIVNTGFYLLFGTASLATVKLLYSVTVGTVINLILVLTIEFYVQYTRRYEIALDNEWLKKENAHFQYESLKNQLNPHFLFNSLNTLLSLITIDQLRAKDFVRKLSHVYRHVLAHREKDLIPLKEEIDVLEDYIFLLQIRFEDDLQTVIDIKEADLRKQIVPLTLQTLLENAVKHNVVLNSRPLIVRVFSDGNHLHVENNRQPKKSHTSWGVGLKSTRSSYKQHQQLIDIYEDKNTFRVSLPLL